MTRRALLSCSNKDGLVDFGRGLARLGFELVSTGGTARHLREAGLDVTDVSAVTGFPEIMEGRVKTLHPAIHGGLLARPTPDHEEALKQHGIGRIEVVAVNLYPFQEVARDPNASLETLVENIDIGGPTMLRSAAKNHESVVVVVDPADYPRILQTLEKGDLSMADRRGLARKVFRHTALYDAAIANRLPGDEEDSAMPEVLVLGLERSLSLRYGENPHQAGAFYRRTDDPEGLDPTRVVKTGKALSYNNLMDVDAAWSLACALGGTSAAVIKHANPCGAARADTLVDAYRKAREADATSAFGSIVALTQPLDADTARAIGESFVEVVAAPEITAEAQDVLGKKKNLRLVELDPRTSSRPWEIRASLTGFLVQQPDRASDSELKVVTRRAPSDEEQRDLAFAMTVCAFVKSNAIVFAKGGVTTGVGAGQMSRVDSVLIAARKAGEAAQGSVMASDAFFPFPDGIVAAHEAGVTAVIQPGGSVRDEEVIAEADRLGMAMVFTGRRHFRH